MILTNTELATILHDLADWIKDSESKSTIIVDVPTHNGEIEIELHLMISADGKTFRDKMGEQFLKSLKK